MITIEEVKKAIRISHNSLDDEVLATMEAAKLDLGTAGMTETDNALVNQAIKLYCMWYFDYNNKAEQYRQGYDNLKSVLALVYPERSGE